MLYHRWIYILLIFVNLIEGDNYYLGGTLTYKAEKSLGSLTLISINQTYLFNHTEVYCNQTMIVQQSPTLVIESLLNPTGNCSRHCARFEQLRSAANTSICTDYSSTLGLTVGQRSNVIGMTDVSYFRPVLSIGSWRKLSLPLNLPGNAFWHVSCSITLRMRSNGQYNSPPVTNMLSPIRIPFNQTYNIRIPAVDADNDRIRCRFANDADECGDVCYPASLPNGTQLSSDCILQITGENIDDWYGVTIIMEDFLHAKSVDPLSSIPVQFLINVQNARSCPSPRLATSVTRLSQCIDQPYEIKLSIRNFCPNITTIKDIAILSMLDVTRTTPLPNKALQSIFLTWKATKIEHLGLQMLCAIAIDSENVQSNQQCVSFNVTEESISSPCPTVISTRQLTTEDTTMISTAIESTSSIILTSHYTSEAEVDTISMSNANIQQTTTTSSSSASVEQSNSDSTNVFSSFSPSFNEATSTKSFPDPSETYTAATEHSISIEASAYNTLPAVTSNVPYDASIITDVSHTLMITDSSVSLATTISQESSAIASNDEFETTTAHEKLSVTTASPVSMINNVTGAATAPGKLSVTTASPVSIINNVTGTTTAPGKLSTTTTSPASMINNVSGTTTAPGKLSTTTTSPASMINNVTGTTTAPGKLSVTTASSASIFDNMFNRTTDEQRVFETTSSSIGEMDGISLTTLEDEEYPDENSSPEPIFDDESSPPSETEGYSAVILSTTELPYIGNSSKPIATSPSNGNDTTVESETVPSGSSSPWKWAAPVIVVACLFLIGLVVCWCCCGCLCCACCKRSQKHVPPQMPQQDNIIHPPKKPYRVENTSENERNLNTNNIQRHQSSKPAPISLSPPPNNIQHHSPTALSQSYMFGNQHRS